MSDPRFTPPAPAATPMRAAIDYDRYRAAAAAARAELVRAYVDAGLHAAARFLFGDPAPARRRPRIRLYRSEEVF
jgi:hypothetical protein